MKKMLFLITVGAAASYFLDPENGTRRRAEAKTKLSSFGQSTPPPHRQHEPTSKGARHELLQAFHAGSRYCLRGHRDRR